jgi:hypothetical protein
VRRDEASRPARCCFPRSGRLPWAGWTLARDEHRRDAPATADSCCRWRKQASSRDSTTWSGARPATRRRTRSVDQTATVESGRSDEPGRVRENRFGNVHAVRPVQIVQSRRRVVTIWRGMDAMGRRWVGLRAWSGITGWRFESSSAHSRKSPPAAGSFVWAAPRASALRRGWTRGSCSPPVEVARCAYS